MQPTRIGLGCAWMYESSPPSLSEVEGLIDSALEMGLTLLDTANVYGPRISECLLGKALTGRRDRFFVTTKTGLCPSDKGGRYRPDGRPESLRASCEASLRRLRTDSVELLLLHRPDPKVPLEESWGAMSEIVEAGKARRIGVSGVPCPQLSSLTNIHPIGAVQAEYSIWRRKEGGRYLDWCEDNGAAFIAYAPLRRGALKSSESDEPGKDPAVNTGRNLQKLAGDLGVTVPQIALAWVLAQGPHVYAIPGTRKVNYLKENFRAAELLDMPSLREFFLDPTVM